MSVLTLPQLVIEHGSKAAGDQLGFPQAVLGSEGDDEVDDQVPVSHCTCVMSTVNILPSPGICNI